MKKAIRFPWDSGGEKVSFETPELTRVEYTIAPFATRLAAALVDRAIIAVFMVLVILCGSLVLVSLLSQRRGEDSGFDPADAFGYVLAFLIAAWFLFSLFYFVLAEVRGEGRTPGKRWMGIRTILGSGQGITFGASLIRNLARLVDEWPPLWILPALSDGNRRVGDYLAGTLVVEEETGKGRPVEARVRLAPSYRELAEKRFYFSSETAGKLYPDDLNLLEHLDERLLVARAAQRRRALLAVATKYVERLGLEEERAQVEEDPKRFLDELELFLRDRFEGEAY